MAQFAIPGNVKNQEIRNIPSDSVRYISSEFIIRRPGEGIQLIDVEHDTSSNFIILKPDFSAKTLHFFADRN